MQGWLAFMNFVFNSVPRHPHFYCGSDGKAVLVLAMKRGSAGLAPIILNFGISWRWVFRFAPTGQQTPVPTEKETGWAPDRRCNTYWVFPVAPSSRSLLSAQQRVCKHSVRCCALQHTAKAGRPTFHPRLWPQHELRALTNKTESCYPRTYIRVKNTWGLRNP